ncbi:zinc finger protein 675 [Exaiptasia diaphana]|uniref:C2H2-type domain-containing protein n=1 Tax=Exaiptasia diaphana TaxID=2652724 RepID=A0A913X667_EXADI|nr:zinc finger protein 675 [Exaiptasia diaphana]
MEGYGVVVERTVEPSHEGVNVDYNELFAPKKINQECKCSFCLPAVISSRADEILNQPIKFIDRQRIRGPPPPLISSSSLLQRNHGISRDIDVVSAHAQMPKDETKDAQIVRDTSTHALKKEKDVTNAPSTKPLTSKNVSCICSFCSKSFTTTRALELHVRRHSGLRPYPCKFCDKSFYQPSERAVHMRTHTGARPYRCPHCLKLFRYSGDLKQHINIHTGQRPYQCETCSKAFTNHSTLRQHKRIHTGERPYKCKECGKTYRYHSSLKQHHTTHLKKAAK